MDNLNLKVCFLGSKNENRDFLLELSNLAIKSSMDARTQYNSNDFELFNEDFKNLLQYTNTKNVIKDKASQINRYLQKSLITSSQKYLGHMVYDQTIMSAIGCISGLMYNQNQITQHLSTKTSILETAVSKDTLKMIGFDFESCKPYGHLSSGGSISNFDAILTSFWVKCIPLSLKYSILNEQYLNICKSYKVQLVNNTFKKFIDLSNWELFNLDCDVCVNLPYELSQIYNLNFNKVFEIIKHNHILMIGTKEFIDLHKIKTPVFIVPASAHYSFSKTASIIGLGLKSEIQIPVDIHGRMDIHSLYSKLIYCIKNKIPVISVVGILGSTQESAVDKFDSILYIRNKLRQKYCFNFDIHVDGAYGGYYLSMIKPDYPIEVPYDSKINNEYFSFKEENDLFTPDLILCDYLKKQLNSIKFADTIIIDGHKSGYVAYSNGFIGFRNQKFKDIVTHTSVYIGGVLDNSNGIFSVEGSRPGHSVVSLYLTHSVIRPSISGYGQLLKKTLLNSKLFYFRLLTFFNDNDNYICVPVGKKISNNSLIYLKSQLIDDLGNFKVPHDIYSNRLLLDELSKIGPDLSVICFTFNFKLTNCIINNEYNKYTEFNKQILQCFNVFNGPETQLILSSTTFKQIKYGTLFISNLLNQLSITDNIPIENGEVVSLRSTIMNPFMCEVGDGDYFNSIFNQLKLQISSIVNNIINKQDK